MSKKSENDLNFDEEINEEEEEEKMTKGNLNLEIEFLCSSCLKERELANRKKRKIERKKKKKKKVVK